MMSVTEVIGYTAATLTSHFNYKNEGYVESIIEHVQYFYFGCFMLVNLWSLYFR